MEERRRQELSSDAEGYLRQLPALTLLDRLPTPMLGIGQRGDIDYANPACAEMLGYGDVTTVTGLYLPTLLTGHEAVPPAACLNTLRMPGTVVEWNHLQQFVIQTIVSEPLLLRETDALLLIGATDITAWMWETIRVEDVRWTKEHGRSRRTEVHGHSRRTEGHGPSRRIDGG